ncbi:hypothetical protein NUW58_g7720 [Xylaria curta]|uniref:Uncharacterized protein n=1 Tax=Xylaria curta TaxID=42375 RepID=A0ACC1NHA1_9PEZI|nr:hypothetical protein NUW58_g7720 [Xylaria curta]
MSHTPQQYQWYPPPPPPAESKPPSTTTQVPKSENIQKPDPELEALRREVEAIRLQDNRKEEARKQRELEEEIEKAKREAERAAQESLVMERKAEEQRLTIVREAVDRGRREAYAELQERQALGQNRVIEQRQRREQEERFVALREAEIRLEKERQQLQSLRAQGEERMRRTLHDIKNEIRADLLEEELKMRRIERPEMADIPTYRGIELMRDTQRVPNWDRELYSDNYRMPVGFDRSRSPDWFQTLLSPTSSQLELGKGQKYPSFHAQPEVVAGKGAVTESLRFDERRQFDEDARHATTFSPEYRHRHNYGPGPPQTDAYDSDNATVIPPPASGSSLKSTPAWKSTVKDANGGSENLGSGQITPTLTSGKHSSTTIADMGAQSSTLGIPVKDAKYEEAEYGKGIEGGPIRHYVDNELHFEALNPRAAEFRPRSRDDTPSGEGTLLPENQSNAIHTGAASQQQGPIGSLPYRPAHGAYYNRPDLSRTHDRKKSSEDYTPRYPVYPRLSVGRGKVPIRPVSYAVEGGIHTRPIMHGISPFLDERSLPIALVPCYILPSYP